MSKDYNESAYVLNQYGFKVIIRDFTKAPFGGEVEEFLYNSKTVGKG